MTAATAGWNFSRKGDGPQRWQNQWRQRRDGDKALGLQTVS
jgi:hypothetical protein